MVSVSSMTGMHLTQGSLRSNVQPFFAKMTDGGHFGHWFTDEYGLPAYEYTCDHVSDPKAAYTTTYGSSRDHWHQLGNDRLNILAHNDGTVEVMEGSRGPQWLVKRDTKRPFGFGGIVIIQCAGNGLSSWSDLYSTQKHATGMRRVFGTGYFRKVTNKNGLILDHVIFAPRSDDAVVLSELAIVNNSDSLKEFILRDYWGVNLRSIIGSLIYSDRKRVLFGPSRMLNVMGNVLKTAQYLIGFAPEQVRDSHSSRFAFQTRYTLDEGTVLLKPVYVGARPARGNPASANFYPESLFLSCLSDPSVRPQTSVKSLLAELHHTHCDDTLSRPLTRRDQPCLSLSLKTSLKPGESSRQSFLFGYASEEAVSDIVKRYRHNLSPIRESSLQFPLLSDCVTAWKEDLVDMKVADASYDWTSRETKWHSYYLRSSALYDEYFQNHFLPQGGAYYYLQGLQGAPRDMVLFSIAATYTAPDLARETLEYVMRMMTSDGKLAYMTQGYGMLGGALVHSRPSDLYLFLLWGLSEYVFATRDFDFLEKRIPFYPRSAGLESSVYVRILLALDYLLDRVGLGEHGLLRAGDGDWNDGISTMVRNRRRFLGEGESMFNSAFALYILPRIASLLTKRGERGRAQRLTATCESLKGACLDSWNGYWFYRGWDGTGLPIGNKSIFLEPLTWFLISGVLSEEQAKRVIHTVSHRLDETSTWGQFLVYPPYRTLAGYLERGCDVNGGTWPAMSALLAWGCSMYSREFAWQSLVKNSMQHHSQAYPNLWPGIWSGPDAFNASYSKRPGETYYNFATPTTDFPVMNLNLHATYLLALLKMMVEPDIEGISFPAGLPFAAFEVRTPVFEYAVGDSRIRGSYAIHSPDSIRLRILVPRRWRTERLRLTIDGSKVQYDTDGNIVWTVIDIPHSPGRFKFDLSMDY